MQARRSLREQRKRREDLFYLRFVVPRKTLAEDSKTKLAFPMLSIEMPFLQPYNYRMRKTAFVLVGMLAYCSLAFADTCRLSKPIPLPVSNLAELWPNGSPVSKTLIIRYASKSGFRDTIELHVANELRYTGESDDTWKSQGRPSKYITGLFGINTGSEETGFIKYPDGVDSPSTEAIEYEISEERVGPSVTTTYLNKARYRSGTRWSGQPDPAEGVAVTFEDKALVGIKLFYFLQDYDHALSSNLSFCVEDATFEKFSEWEYAIHNP